MLLRLLYVQWRLTEAFVIKKQHFFEEGTEWNGMFGKVRDKFS